MIRSSGSSLIVPSSTLLMHNRLLLAGSEVLATSSGDASIEEKMYMEEFNVSLDETRSRNNAIEQAHALSDILSANYANFVDMYTEHEPDFKIVFTYKKNSSRIDFDLLNEYLKSGELSKYLKIRYVKYSSEELKRTKDATLNVLNENYARGFKVYIDPILNKVVAEVSPVEQTQIEMNLLQSGVKSSLPDGSGSLIIKPAEDTPKFTTWGGGLLVKAGTPASWFCCKEW